MWGPLTLQVSEPPAPPLAVPTLAWAGGPAHSPVTPLWWSSGLSDLHASDPPELAPLKMSRMNRKVEQMAWVPSSIGGSWAERRTELGPGFRVNRPPPPSSAS